MKDPTLISPYSHFYFLYNYKQKGELFGINTISKIIETTGVNIDDRVMNGKIIKYNDVANAMMLFEKMV